jgi:hypothetical protein
MKGTDIIQKLGTDEVHDFIEHEMVKIDPDYDYVIVRGTSEHPRIVCKDHEAAIMKGRYLRLRIEGREIVTDEVWTTGHNAFEGNVEPRFSPERPKGYMIK